MARKTNSNRPTSWQRPTARDRAKRPVLSLLRGLGLVDDAETLRTLLRFTARRRASCVGGNAANALELGRGTADPGRPTRSLVPATAPPRRSPPLRREPPPEYQP